MAIGQHKLAESADSGLGMRTQARHLNHGLRRPHPLATLLSDFGGLDQQSKQLRQLFWIDEQLDAAGRPGLPFDESSSFEGQHHLMNGIRSNAKIFLHFGFGRRSAV